MRRVSQGFLVAMVLVSLAVPAGARTREDERGKSTRPSIVETLKKWIVRSFGDGLIVPRP
jgi:hypothetical protein